MLVSILGTARLLYGEAPTHRWCRVPAGKLGFAWAWQAVLRVAGRDVAA
jgi:hypothetical protein